MPETVKSLGEYMQCVCCIMDTSVPGISFTKEGICNFCTLQNKMEKEFPIGEKGKKKLNKIVSKIKKAGEHKKYNCIIGISGGRDSTYTIYLAKKILGLNPLAVHFNDGFGNPIAKENMIKACTKLDIDMETVTSNWEESKDLKISFLKGSTLDIEEGTDIGIAGALYGIAVREKIKYILIGQSFRTEGIAPLSWNYMDGKYLKSVHKLFGKVPLKRWTPTEPGFNLGIQELLYYTLLKRIKTVPILYYVDYVRKETDNLLTNELNWVNPGAHYFDDLYQSVICYYQRVKFGVDRRIYHYSALVRSEQMTKEEALEKVKKIYILEDPKVIQNCIEKLGLTTEEFNRFTELSPKKFSDYPNNYNFLKKFRFFIWILSKLNLLPGSTYYKYFKCGS